MNCWANSDTATFNGEEVNIMNVGNILIGAGMILCELLDDDGDSSQ